MNMSLNIQNEEFRNFKSTPETQNFNNDKTRKRIMEILEPLGFDWAHDDYTEEKRKPFSVVIYRDSPTHLWFATACDVVKIEKEKAERLLVLGFL